MKLFYDTFPTACGDFSLALDESGAIAATAFGDVSALQSRLGDPIATLERETSLTLPARRQVRAYFAGELREFDLPLAANGTAFQRRAWQALQLISFGATRTYGDLARELRSSPRAVGRANATNPICLIVPCHRVIGADGSLTGFAFGEEIKQKLLDHERSLTATSRAA
jgi:methylated-DNA-[protein]-cysteine S-methyltransferase